MVFLFVLISSLLKNTILFSWLIDGFLILKFYLIFSLFGCFSVFVLNLFLLFLFITLKENLLLNTLEILSLLPSILKFLKMYFLLVAYLKLTLLSLLILIIQMISGTQLQMITLPLQQKIILTVLVLSNAFSNLKNLTALGLNPLIQNLLTISFLYLLLCVFL